MTVDQVLERIRAHLDLEAETEYELLAEIRGHLEDAVEAAQRRGLDPDAALAEAAACFGVDQVGEALQAAHVGQGTAEGVMAAALPVLCALVLRWLVFAPGGTFIGWQELLSRPVFWAIAWVALLVPLFKFTRWRYALVTWALFWALSVTLFAWSAVRW
jgi:hypothetical protein